jgi:hypothetical protein
MPCHSLLPRFGDTLLLQSWKMSQKMKRLCMGSQFMTILIFVGYAGMNAFTLQLTPHAGSCVNLWTSPISPQNIGDLATYRKFSVRKKR